MSKGRQPERHPRKRVSIDDFAEDDLLTPSDVAGIFQVDPKTVRRWTIEGKMKCLRLPSGHRRFEVAEVRRYRLSGLASW